MLSATVLLLNGAASAHGWVGYSGSHTLSEPEVTDLYPRVVVDSEGRATAGWIQDGPGLNTSVLSRRIAPNGDVEPTQVIAASGGEPEMVVDAEDRVTLVWLAGDFPEARVFARRLAADGTPGPTQALSNPGEYAEYPDLAVDADGQVTVVWVRDDDGGIQSRQIHADGTLGPLQTLTEPDADADFPRVAVDPQGRATVVWRSFTRGIEARRIKTDGSLDSNWSVWGVDGPDDGFISSSPQIVADSHGRATVAWLEHSSSSGSWTSLMRSRRLGVDGTPEGAQVLSESETNPNDPKIVIDSEDRATIAWVLSAPSAGTVQLRRLGTDGSPEPLRTLSDGVQFMDLAIDSEDRVTGSWSRYSTIQTRRMDATGEFEPTQTVPQSHAGLSYPTLGAGHGSAVVWMVSDGSGNWQIRVALGIESVPSLHAEAVDEADLGEAIDDQAVLLGAYDPGGQIIFSLYGPDDETCTSAPVLVSPPVPVLGNGDYFSPEYIPAEPGTYRWVASYSGDANNPPMAMACNYPGQSSLISAPATPTPNGPGATLTQPTLHQGAIRRRKGFQSCSKNRGKSRTKCRRAARRRR